MFTEEARNYIQESIAANGGRECLFYGYVDRETGLIDRIGIRLRANGSRHSVALMLCDSARPTWIIHNHPRGDLTPSWQDDELAGLFAEKGVGSLIINNAVTLARICLCPPMEATDDYAWA